ncbi:MAG: DoxX family protein, partial [Sedimenticola sp.]|nr:DoxX family protein [Sedimenticola sp.]
MRTLIAKFESLFEMIGQLIPASLLGLIARLVIAYTFFSSGRTKVSGIL